MEGRMMKNVWPRQEISIRPRVSDSFAPIRDRGLVSSKRAAT